MAVDYLIPEDLYYTKDHLWVKVDGKLAVVGVTEYGQDQLGDVVFVELPNVDDFIDAGDKLATIESIKAAVDVASPLTGRISSVNEELKEEPSLINTEPYGDGWLVEIEMKDPTEIEDLMTAKDYKIYLEELEEEEAEDEE